MAAAVAAGAVAGAAIGTANANARRASQLGDASGFIDEFRECTSQLDLEQAFAQPDSLFKVIPIFLSDLSGDGPPVWDGTEEMSRQLCDKLYDLIDLDGEGGVSPADLKHALVRLGVQINIATAKKLIEEVDKDGNGELDREEFAQAVLKQQLKAMEAEQASEAATMATIEQQAKAMPCAGALQKAVTGCVALRDGVSSPACRQSAHDKYRALAKWVERKIVYTVWFDALVICFIVLVGVNVFVELEFGSGGAKGWFMRVITWAANVLFTLEVVVKVVAKGPKPLDYFEDSNEGVFNTFDFVVVVLSWATLGQEGAIVPVCRLLRLVKIMNKISQLRIILLGLVAGMRAVGPIMLLMLLIMFLFSIIGNLAFGKNDPAHFSNVQIGMLTLFKVATLASWGDQFQINYYGCDKFGAGLYALENFTYYEPDGRDAADDHFAAAVDDDAASSASRIRTAVGSFHGFTCSPDESQANPIAACVFFFVFTVLTAYVVLSLFISVITSTMTELIQAKAQEREERLLREQLSPKEKKKRMQDSLHKGNSEVKEHLDKFFVTLEDVKAVGCMRFVKVTKKIVETNSFHTAIMMFILAVAVVEVLETNAAFSEEQLKPVQFGFIAVFSLECLIKITAQWPRPQRYFRDNWNTFDFAIVVLSYADLLPPSVRVGTGGVAALRLLRLMRVVRLLNSFPALQSVTQSLILAFSNVGYVMLMILIINYIFACAAVLFWRENDPQHFKHMSSAIMSIWQVETFDAWEEMLYTNIYGCENYLYEDLHGFPTTKRRCDPELSSGKGWLAVAFFLFVIVIGGFILPTVLIGVISVAFDESTKMIRDDKHEKKCEAKVLAKAAEWGVDGEAFVTEAQVVGMRKVFDLINFDSSDKGTQSLEADELIPFLSFVCEHYLSPQPDEKLQAMFEIVDVSGDNEVGREEPGRARSR